MKLEAAKFVVMLLVFCLAVPDSLNAQTTNATLSGTVTAWIHGPGMILTPILGALAYDHVFLHHASDELANFLRQRRSTATRLPASRTGSPCDASEGTSLGSMASDPFQSKNRDQNTRDSRAASVKRPGRANYLVRKQRRNTG